MDSASASARVAEGELHLEVRLALDGARGEELARLRLDRIRGLAVAVPQRLRLRARRFGGACFQRSWMSCSSRAAFSMSSGLSRSYFFAERLGLRDHLFLDGGVGEPLPLVHLAQLVQLRSEDGERRLQALDEVLALVMRQGQRRFDRGAQVARGLVGLLQREVVGLGALVRPLDQLVDALHLLAERLLGGRLLRFRALADRRLGRGVALLDRLVEPLGLLVQPAPLARHRVPRIGGTVFLRRELLGLARQLVEPGVHLRAFLAVLVPGARAGARLLEPLHEALVRRPLPDPPAVLPIRTAPPRADPARLRRGRPRPARTAPCALRAAAASLRLPLLLFGALARLALDDRPRGADGAVEARAVRRRDLVGRRRATSSRQAASRLVDLLFRARHRRRRRERLGARDRAGDALLMLLEHRLARRFRVVHGLHHRAGALGDRLALGAVGEPFERGAIDRAAGRGPLQRADAGVLVLGPGRDVEELRVVLDPLGRERGGAGIGGVAARPSSAT